MLVQRYMSRKCFLTLCVLSVAARAATSAGASLARGRGIQVTVDMARSSYVEGEPALSLVCVSNGTDRTIALEPLHVDSNVHVMVRAPTGEMLDYRPIEPRGDVIKRKPTRAELEKGYMALGPGQSCGVIIAIADHFAMPAAAGYEVRASVDWRSCRAKADRGHVKLKTKHSTTSAPMQIEIQVAQGADAQLLAVMKKRNSVASTLDSSEYGDLPALVEAYPTARASGYLAYRCATSWLGLCPITIFQMHAFEAEHADFLRLPVAFALKASGSPEPEHELAKITSPLLLHCDMLRTLYSGIPTTRFVGLDDLAPDQLSSRRVQ